MSETTRYKILDAAARLFSERGFNNTPTSLLAREAGISEGSIYRHFTCKDEIFLSLITGVREELELALKDAMTKSHCQSGLARISCVVEVYSNYVRENRRNFALIFRDAPTRAGDNGSKVQDELRAIHDFILDSIRRALKQGIAEGSIRADIDVVTTSAMLCSLVLGLTRMRFFDFLPDDYVGPDAVRETLERLLSV